MKVDALMNSSKTTAATKQMDMLYEDILQWKVNRTNEHYELGSLEIEMQQKKTRWIMRTLQLTFVAFNPLTMESLTEAISLNDDANIDQEIDATFVTALCSNLITSNAYGKRTGR